MNLSRTRATFERGALVFGGMPGRALKPGGSARSPSGWLAFARARRSAQRACRAPSSQLAFWCARVCAAVVCRGSAPCARHARCALAARARPATPAGGGTFDPPQTFWSEDRERRGCAAQPPRGSAPRFFCELDRLSGQSRLCGLRARAFHPPVWSGRSRATRVSGAAARGSAPGSFCDLDRLGGRSRLRDLGARSIRRNRSGPGRPARAYGERSRTNV